MSKRKKAKKITIRHARKVLDIVDCGLVSGLGVPEPGKLCVEAAVCLALGEPHGDEPSCVAKPDREFKIRLNDSNWSSPTARARGLRRVSVQQLGTAGTNRDEWLRILCELIIRRVVPPALMAAAKICPDHRKALLDASDRCVSDGSIESARAAYAASYAANDANAANYAAYAANAASYAANYAAYAANAAANAANAAANYAAYAANAAVDQILLVAARCAEEAYERTGSLGVELLKGIEAGK